MYNRYDDIYVFVDTVIMYDHIFWFICPSKCRCYIYIYLFIGQIFSDPNEYVCIQTHVYYILL